MEATLSCQQRIVISINDHHKAEDGKKGCHIRSSESNRDAD
jgi:hypothetical protein